MNLADLSDLMKTKEIQPSDKIFGFLGAGAIGQGIIKNLINSDHKVNLYSRTISKVRMKMLFLQGNAKNYQHFQHIFLLGVRFNDCTLKTCVYNVLTNPKSFWTTYDTLPSNTTPSI